MNGTTQNDLSFNKTILDFQALKASVAIATRELRENIHREDSKLLTALLDNDVTAIHMSAERIRDYAKNLAVTADTYSALLGSESRGYLSVKNRIINKEQ